MYWSRTKEPAIRTAYPPAHSSSSSLSTTILRFPPSFPLSLPSTAGLFVALLLGAFSLPPSPKSSSLEYTPPFSAARRSRASFATFFRDATVDLAGPLRGAALARALRAFGASVSASDPASAVAFDLPLVAGLRARFAGGGGRRTSSSALETSSAPSPYFCFLRQDWEEGISCVALVRMGRTYLNDVLEPRTGVADALLARSKRSVAG